MEFRARIYLIMTKKKETKRIENNLEYFSTPIWSTSLPEWVDEINKVCVPYLDEAHERHSDSIKKNKGDDFGLVYHSTSIQYESKLEDFANYIIKTGWNLLDTWGHNMTDYSLFFDSMWVQEFAKNGGGHHRVHIHENCHLSGFYFLENEESSFPLFHDPRPGAAMTSLPQKNESMITPATRVINYQPKPGDMYIFPSYLPHEYVVSRGGNFRFIHFNIQAVKNYMLNSREGGIG